MTELTDTQPEASSVDLSDKLDVSAVGGGQVTVPEEDGAPVLTEEEQKQNVVKEAIQKSLETKEGKAEEVAKEESEAAAVEKPKKERAPDGKFAPKAPVEPQEGEGEADAQEDARIKRPPPPESLSEDAKAKWKMVPQVIQSEVNDYIQKATEEAEKYKPAVERYDRIKHWDDLAQQNGTDLRIVLENVNKLENMIMTDPLTGLDTLIKQVLPGRSLMDIAQHVVGLGQHGLQQHSQQIQQRQQAQHVMSEASEAQTLRQELDRIKREHEVERSVIAPFVAKNPNYYEYEADIVKYLNSAIIDRDLPPQQRLQEAYDRVDRDRAASPRAFKAEAQDVERRLEPDLSGQKSLKPSLGVAARNVTSPPGKTAKDSVLKALEAARRR